MITTFRKKRRKLAEDNNFKRYFRYAFGEVVLIILGIFSALQLQNWNEKIKMEKQFKVVLEQLYNSIQSDINIYKSQKERLDNQLFTLDTLLTKPDIYPKKALPYLLYRVGYENSDDYISETNYHLSKLVFNPENFEQNEIARQITNYTTKINQKVEFKDDALWLFLAKNEIAFGGIPNKDRSRAIRFFDKDFYYNEDINKSEVLIKSPKLRSILKTLLNEKLILRDFAYNRLEDAKSIMNLIKTYHPEVRLLYQDVGILGTAIEGYINVKSKPLTLTNFNKNIWEIDIYLKRGTVKFRCRDSWNQNWGGKSFPKGQAEHDGPDIPVKKGNYHIILNLSDGTYEFIKEDNKKIKND